MRPFQREWPKSHAHTCLLDVAPNIVQSTMRKRACESHMMAPWQRAGLRHEHNYYAYVRAWSQSLTHLSNTTFTRASWHGMALKSCRVNACYAVPNRTVLARKRQPCRTVRHGTVSNHSHERNRAVFRANILSFPCQGS